MSGFLHTSGRKLVAALGLVVAVSLLASGCQAGIPRSGPVYPGPAEAPPAEQSLVFNPDRPVNGASKEEIVRGFVAAASSATGDYAIAREFLTPDLNARWNPHTSITVDAGLRTVKTEDDTVRMIVSPNALVDAHGSMRSAREGRSVENVFELRSIGGEWRVNAAPDGIVLDENTFEAVFNEHSLYFLAAQSNILVPDQRWFLRGATTATRIVTELLLGPSELLADSVTTTAFPEGTALAANSVPVGSNVAHVDLTPEALSADENSLRLMLAQLESSLIRVAGVTRADISVDQSVVLAGPADPSWSQRYPRVPGKPVVMVGDQFGELGSTGLTPIPRLSEAIRNLAPTSIDYSAPLESAAIGTANGVAIVTASGQGQVIPVDGRSGLIAPTIDSRGFVWTVPASNPRDLNVTNAAGASGKILAPWIDAVGVEVLSVSRDGTRMLVVYNQGGEYIVAVSGIVRDGNGMPTTMTDPVEIQLSTDIPVDADWVDESHIALASKAVGNNVEISLLSVGGRAESLGTTEDVVSIAGGNSVSQLRIVDSGGVLREYRGSNWQESAAEVTLLAKQA
ncbi:LpqB family beta-propeller domain-containing protein [Lysinibacter cavernae]|uniref:GerMN domain-containing protein n=1 Tax=Lysinibacter cavernae TaxID=1640652 RepID=A0A7X5TSR8_9MICO|nr:LpqB family beta-propeller domain-containing protein [Lysinibacter cavernae]NIH53811.1 hypothetical protein [Lysinibacter cavernae]